MTEPAEACRYVVTDDDGTSHCTLAAHDATAYDRGYDDGYQAAAVDEDAIDARNRILLEALRSDVVSRCRTWRSMTDDSEPPPPAITIISIGDELHRAALALANHCAPRSGT